MKRCIKKTGKKGFTLVETLLATFILVVISTMLINGFVSSMGYSYQTSVYSKSGANNYTACMDDISQWSHLENHVNSGASATDAGNTRQAQGKKLYVASGKSKTVKFNGTIHGGSGSLPDLEVGLESHTDLSLTAPGTVDGYAFSPDDTSLVDNRITFVYYPSYWQDGEKNDTCGRIVVRGDYSKTPVVYDWVIDNGNEDLSGATKASKPVYKEDKGN